jgi:prepilin-type N-terminal cleavage/methylation domain-containing protein
MTRSNGFTLLEMMVTMSILTVVMLGMYSLNDSMTRSSMQQESLAMLRDEGRLSLQYMTRLMRMAQSGTLRSEDGGEGAVMLGTQSVQSIQFQIVASMDGNVTTINQDFTVGLSPVMEFTPDFDDANEDGFTSTQLVHLDADGSVVRVLTNHLNPDGGFACIRTAGGLQLSLVLFDAGNSGRQPVTKRLDQVFAVRN